mmetsp:Transcript_10804/g.27202  ORF Transcript_10804/g.27202 Transcript_10804/m.27202 type:complete len:317 (-) Transcript_10804:313-1263(-)
MWTRPLRTQSWRRRLRSPRWRTHFRLCSRHRIESRKRHQQRHQLRWSRVRQFQSQGRRPQRRRTRLSLRRLHQLQQRSRPCPAVHQLRRKQELRRSRRLHHRRSPPRPLLLPLVLRSLQHPVHRKSFECLRLSQSLRPHPSVLSRPLLTLRRQRPHRTQRSCPLVRRPLLRRPLVYTLVHADTSLYFHRSRHPSDSCGHFPRLSHPPWMNVMKQTKGHRSLQSCQKSCHSIEQKGQSWKLVLLLGGAAQVEQPKPRYSLLLLLNSQSSTQSFPTQRQPPTSQRKKRSSRWYRTSRSRSYWHSCWGLLGRCQLCMLR